MNFGDELKKIRESRGMTVNQLSMYSGVSSASISRYETGDRGIPKPPTIEKLAKGLKYDYTQLMKIAGYIDEPVELSAEEAAQRIIGYLDGELTNEQIVEKINLKVDGIPITPEEMDEFISFVRWQRSKKNERPAASKSEEL